MFNIKNSHIKTKFQIPKEEELIDLEEALSFQLPMDYKKFLTWSNGGRLYYNKLNRLLSDGTIQKITLEKFYSISEAVKIYGFTKDRNYFDQSDIIFPIAESIGSPFIGLGINDTICGKIYVIDDDFGATLQASNLVEFIDQIDFDDSALPPPWEYY